MLLSRGVWTLATPFTGRLVTSGRAPTGTNQLADGQEGHTFTGHMGGRSCRPQPQIRGDLRGDLFDVGLTVRLCPLDDAPRRPQNVLPQHDRALLFGPSQRVGRVHECLRVARTSVDANDDAGVSPVRDDLRLNHVIVALDAPEETRTVLGGERHGCLATGSEHDCNP